MTCIIGYVDKKNSDIYMGADSSAVAGDAIYKRSDEKVFVNGPMIFGFAGSFRMGQILRYSFEIPKQSKKKNDYEYLCTDFVDKLTECFTKKGFAAIEDNVISISSTFLIGFNGNLYDVGPDFQVGKDLVSYTAIGAGEQFARGALYILDQSDIPTDQKVYMALEAAEEFSAAVSSPYTIMKLTKDQESFLITSDPNLVTDLNSFRTYNKLKKKG